MSKLKVCIPVTSRGNYGKFKSIMREIDKNPALELQLIVGGGSLLQKYGDFVNEGELAGFEVDLSIYFIVEGENPVTMAKSTGLALTEFTTAFKTLQPDVVLTIADRFEELAIAAAATFQNIPLAHIEGGEISGSIDESLRHAITKLSHLHFPASETAAERISNLGEPDDSIFPVGATSLDILENIDLSDTERLETELRNRGVGGDISLTEDYLLVIQHPVTTEYQHNRKYTEETIDAIDKLDIPAIWLWPNMDAGTDGVSKAIRVYREHNDSDHIRWYTSLPIEQYGKILYNSSCIVGNSSSGIRESAYLGVPAVNIGNRQAGRQRGENVIDVSYDSTQILSAIESQVEHGKYESADIYGNGDSAEMIVDILIEYEFEIQKRLEF